MKKIIKNNCEAINDSAKCFLYRGDKDANPIESVLFTFDYVADLAPSFPDETYIISDNVSRQYVISLFSSNGNFELDAIFNNRKFTGEIGVSRLAKCALSKTFNLECFNRVTPRLLSTLRKYQLCCKNKVELSISDRVYLLEYITMECGCNFDSKEIINSEYRLIDYLLFEQNHTYGYSFMRNFIR